MRKTRINLYGREFRPREEFPGLKHMLAAWLLILLAAGAASGWAVARKNAAAAEERRITAELESANERLLRARELAGARAADPELAGRLGRLKETLEAKKSFAAFVAARKAPGSGGFGGFMKALASLDYDGITLTGFTVRDGAAGIEGLARDGGAVPRWVEQFGTRPELAGLSFGAVKFARGAAGGPLEFSLKSEAPGDKAGGEEEPERP